MAKSVSETIKEYVKLRDAILAWKKKNDELEAKKKAALEKIEVWLLDQANKTGVDSFKTEHGTAYKTLKEHYRIQDWSAFIEFVKETNNYALLQKRVTKTVAKEVHNETGELPKGLDYFSEYTINVRRPSNR